MAESQDNLGEPMLVTMGTGEDALTIEAYPYVLMLIANAINAREEAAARAETLPSRVPQPTRANQKWRSEAEAQIESQNQADIIATSQFVMAKRAFMGDIAVGNVLEPSDEETERATKFWVLWNHYQDSEERLRMVNEVLRSQAARKAALGRKS